MDFTGTALVLKRSIYPQTGNYSFDMTCAVDNTTGQYNFGLSGNGNVIDFLMQSGKIYFNNKFLHSYRSNQEFSLSADFTSATTNVRKDDSALIYAYPKQTGFFEYFYFKRQNAGMGATFDVEISGNNIPSYVISQNGFLTTSGQLGVTGNFINYSNFPIKIFDSSIQSSEPYSFANLNNPVNGFTTGKFVYSGDFSSIDFSQPIFTIFNTNFGDTNILFTITDLRAVAGFVLLDTITDFTLDANSGLNRDVNYTNYSGGFQTSNFNTQLTFVLDYVSGSGVFGGYNKSFTGAWNMMTGINLSALYAIPTMNDNAATRMMASGTFQPNTFVNFQLNHVPSGTNADATLLTISGALVFNPQSATINVQN